MRACHSCFRQIRKLILQPKIKSEVFLRYLNKERQLYTMWTCLLTDRSITSTTKFSVVVQVCCKWVCSAPSHGASTRRGRRRRHANKYWWRCGGRHRNWTLSEGWKSVCRKMSIKVWQDHGVGGLLWTRRWTFGFYNWRGIPWPSCSRRSMHISLAMNGLRQHK